MKRPSVSWLYLALFGACIVGIAKVSEDSKKLYAFSHSLDMHANESAIEEAHRRKCELEAKDRKRIEEEKRRREDERRNEERRKKTEELKIKRQEEERVARQQWEEENRKKYS